MFIKFILNKPYKHIIRGVDLCGNEDDGHELKNQTLFLEKLADYTDINPNFYNQTS